MEENNCLYSQEELLIRLVSNGANMYGYLIPRHRGVLPEAVARHYGVSAVIDNWPEAAMEYGFVAPESAQAWRGLFAAVERGEKNSSAMVSLKTKNGGFGRFWLRLDTIFDEEGRPSGAIITVDDFTEVSRQVLLRENDINGLLQATQKVFPEILTLNLTRNTYRMLQYDSATTMGTPREGVIDEMIRIRLNGVVPEDQESFVETFSAGSLRRAFLENERESVQLVYRRPGREGRIHWMETTVIRQQNTLGSDVLLVAMSHSVDQQKAEERRLQEQLRLQAEELRLTMSRVGKIINYYEVSTGTLTIPPAQAKIARFPNKIPNFPECFIADPPPGYGPETLQTLQRFYDTIRCGNPTGSCEYTFVDEAGTKRWERMEFASVFDAEGLPLRAVISVDDITHDYAQAAENRRLKENERVLQMIAQHSGRVVAYYDLATRTVRSWGEDDVGGKSIAELFALFPPESTDKLDRIFQDIHSGVPSGEDKVLITGEKEQRRWMDVKYSTLYNDEKRPTGALFSYRDVTEEYEHELAYLRYVQSVEFDKEKHLLVIESDLVADRVETVGGQLFPPGEQQVVCSHSRLIPRLLGDKFRYEDMEAAEAYFSAKNLLRLHAQGERHLSSEWKVRFQDGALRWLDTEIVLMVDPYTDHVKGFLRMLDITEEKAAQMEARHRSEQDGMTGLLNRATVEERIRRAVEGGREKGGILAVVDLDDLKGINDTFGHKEGDRAINGVAQALKVHFRESDIIGRAGGDEFFVFLPGAAENGTSIAVSIAALLRRLSGIAIGGHDERRIHCSIGCAVQTPEIDGFEELFRRADMALYHVKRSGKNNFAFYTPEMEQEDYRFQAQKLILAQSAKKHELGELQYLLDAITTFYPLVLSANLSANDYYLMEAEGAFAQMPAFGVLDDFVRRTAAIAHPDDIHIIEERLSRKALLQAYARGEGSVRCHFRRCDGREYLWTEASVIFYTNESGDVCDFSLMRRARERVYELDRLWLHKVLELAVMASFEYICLINTDSGEYFWHGDGTNTHDVSQSGGFDEATREIRDRFIAPEEREAYYESARLDRVVERMEAGKGVYTYRYNMPDGAREASFHWFEPTHRQLLMTVQRCR